MRTYCTIAFLLWCCCAGLNAQSSPATSFSPDDILVQGDRRAKVLLVGTFHFNYPNLDSHKTAPEDQVDIQSEQRARELRELLDYLARFQPTEIVVERHAGSSVNEDYRRYLAGDFELGRGEIHQIAFRLGKQFGVDSLIKGDAPTLSQSIYWHPDSLVLRPFLDSIFHREEEEDTEISRRYMQLYDHEDEILKDMTLLEYFRYENDPHRIRRGHGHYLEFTDDRDPDALALWWYARNLRIYRNIQKAVTAPEDRVLVLFGAGHLGILRQQFESSPRFELVDFGAL